jgi:hypothetical protein
MNRFPQTTACVGLGRRDAEVWGSLVGSDPTCWARPSRLKLVKDIWRKTLQVIRARDIQLATVDDALIDGGVFLPYRDGPLAPPARQVFRHNWTL